MTEQELLRDCVRRLNESGVTYMVTGSMASNAWGIPRTTHDLDFVLQLPPSQISKFASAFDDPDYFLDEASVRSAYRPPHQFNVIHIPSALKADFWLLSGEPFEREMFHRRIQDTWFGQKMWIATAEDIVLHKLHWNRISPSERQRADIGGVIAVQKGKLDEGYLRRWASEMGLSKELEDALAGKLKLKQT